MEFLSKSQGHLDMEQLSRMCQTPFAEMSYDEAIDVLQKSGRSFSQPVRWGVDLATEHERFLAEEYCARPLLVFHYPKEVKAFYMRQLEDGKRVAAMDLLLPGVGEVIGGAQREERLERLTLRMEELQIPSKDLEWYLDLRRFGSVTHSGFGMGLERMLLLLTGMRNIRDVIPCPRVPGNLRF